MRSRTGATRSSRSEGVQSNHTRQVAAVAARLGLRAVLVQEHWVDWPDSVYDKVGNILLSRIMGADVRLSAEGFDIGFRPSWEAALASVTEDGGTPYPIPAGALRPSARRPRLRPLGGRGAGTGAPSRDLLRHGDRLFGDRLHAGGHDRRFCEPGPAASRARHRCVGDRPADVGAGRPYRSPNRRGDRPRQSRSPTTRSCCSTAGTPGAYGVPDRRTLDAIRLCAALRACSPTRSTRASRWRR